MPGLAVALRAAAHPDLDLWGVGAGVVCLAMLVGALVLLGAMMRAEYLRTRREAREEIEGGPAAAIEPAGENRAGDEARRLDAMLADQRRWS